MVDLYGRDSLTEYALLAHSIVSLHRTLRGLFSPPIPPTPLRSLSLLPGYLPKPAILDNSIVSRFHDYPSISSRADCPARVVAGTEPDSLDSIKDHLAGNYTENDGRTARNGSN